MFRGQETEEEDKKAPDGGRQGWCVCACMCACVWVCMCAHTERHAPWSSGLQVNGGRGQGMLHEGDGAKWAKPAFKVRRILQSEQHWLGACLMSEEGWSGCWHGGSRDSGRRRPRKCGQTPWHCWDLHRDPGFPLSGTEGQ